jgi:hypothetical protein
MSMPAGMKSGRTDRELIISGAIFLTSLFISIPAGDGSGHADRELIISGAIF